jgi:hypothetical protein
VTVQLRIRDTRVTAVGEAVTSMSFGKIKIFLPNGPWFQHPGQPAAVAWRRRNRDHFDAKVKPARSQAKA